MLNNIFKGIFQSSTDTVLSVSDFLLCVFAALVSGIILALVYTYKNKFTKSFVVTLAMLPAVVCVVIMMVNGNIGAGVAVAGAFSLVRFRSAPGTAHEIGTIFIAMGSGLIAGMGYLAYSLLFTIVMALIMIIYNTIGLGKGKNTDNDKILRITIPEDLDYTDIFDDLFEQYTSSHQIVSVKTTNMGSMFKLTYNVALKDITLEKAFIDELRCRNGNLEINMSRQEATSYEL